MILGLSDLLVPGLDRVAAFQKSTNAQRGAVSTAARSLLSR